MILIWRIKALSQIFTNKNPRLVWDRGGGFVLAVLASGATPPNWTAFYRSQIYNDCNPCEVPRSTIV